MSRFKVDIYLLQFFLFFIKSYFLQDDFVLFLKTRENVYTQHLHKPILTWKKARLTDSYAYSLECIRKTECCSFCAENS